MTASATENTVRGLHIGGRWTDAEGGGTFEDGDPYTGEAVASIPAGTREDARRAIQAAAEAFPGWSHTPPAERQRIFLKAADLLEARQEDVGSWLTRETGATFGFAMFQLHFVPNLFRQAAALAYAPIGEIIPSDTGAFAMGIRRPVGVVGAIAPWNAALILSARAIAAPLALGNAVVLKPSEHSPYVGGLLWGDIFAEAGLPEGALNIVTHAPGEAGPIAEELTENPAVRVINFTGSTNTGRELAEAAGRNLKRILLELGGSNPLIVLGDADLDYAVDASAFGAFLHQGQICMSARRIIVEQSIADTFVDRLVEKTKGLKAGDPKEQDTIIGPLITEDAVATVKSRVDDVVRQGAKVLAGGEAEGSVYQATLLRDVPDDSEFAQVETFGPVASIDVVASADEAVERANNTAYGLTAGIITSDTERGLALAQKIQAGIVHVNDQTVDDEPQMPFGGVKESGFGRFGGTAAISEFTELHWVTVSASHPFPF
ncbi:MAG TPA: aldehyde dehydrogenase family protein [Gaiellaceae bacterium]|jgi:acyl-CoA reductase-like NAD-dependent aldehyde dehydrogenase|nr:aldehyde dehydrogenase family protein [Gaiellaceae bacterium]